MHRFIVIEGIDGSGKSTQYRLLCERLTAEGHDFRKLVFPRYDNPSSALIRMYLNGEFGSHPADVSAYAASAFFAVDRYASYKTVWQDDYQNGRLILSDRYTTSNAVHQGSKLPEEALPDYLSWLRDFEFQRMALPEPDLVLYLDVDAETSLAQLSLRQHATNTQADIHEQDTDYLRACVRTGRYAADYFGWKRICCLNPDGSMRGIEEIHETVYTAVKGVL
ncbi:MAG: dTMP kinase [Oscillospiraceae bacterium]|jgi:dTMP kinase